MWGTEQDDISKKLNKRNTTSNRNTTSQLYPLLIIIIMDDFSILIWLYFNYASKN